MSTSGGVRRTSAGASVAQIERQIATLPYEMTYVLSDGKVVASHRGSDTGRNFSDAEARQMRGAVVTHNHPQLRSFSNADVELAYRAQVGQMRAVDAHYTYTMSPPAGRNWSANLWNYGDSRARVPRYSESPRLDRARGHSDVFSRINGRVQRQYDRLVASGAMTRAQADSEIPHQIWTRFARATGVQYQRTPRRG